MKPTRKSPAGKDGANLYMTVQGEGNSNLFIAHCNHAYNVLDVSGQRIASFIHKSKAQAFAMALSA